MDKTDCPKCEYYKEGRCFGFTPMGEDLTEGEFMCGEFRTRT